MGFFPAEAPQIAIIVVLDEPQRDKWGGVASAPVFKKIGEQILNSYKTNIRDQNAIEERVIVPKKETLQLVSTPPAIPNSEGMENESQEAMMPDFRGLTIRDALRKAKGKSIEIKVVGNGWAVAQAPLPGVPLSSFRSCTITFQTGQ